VFDEVYFKAFAAHYLDGHYYFDIHPPLGKLILAGFGQLTGLNADAMLNGTALALRILPAIAGILLVPLMWGLLRRLGASRPFAFLGALLVLLDNALLTESRFILMDSMLLLFGLSALYFYLMARDSSTPGQSHLDAVLGESEDRKGGVHRRTATADRSFQRRNAPNAIAQRWLWLTLAAASAGAAASIKWTGLTSLVLVALIWLWDQASRRTSWLNRFAEATLLVLLPLVIYVGSFWLHFKLLPKSGTGDAFMSTQFQATLIGNPVYDPTASLSFPDKLIELNQEMYRANQTLTATHPYGSHWYTWPLEQRPIYYWQGPQLTDGRQGNIYLLGNPVIWWGVWIAIICGLAYAYIKRRTLRPATTAALALAGTAYLINLIPFMAVSRVMFLYHYFFSFLFSLITAIILWNDLATDSRNRQLATKPARQLFGAIIILVALGFAFFTPLTYGSPLTPSELQARIWLPSWR
jgi:dolichyl-phosphate-mannose-protein mannosyltransferase